MILEKNYRLFHDVIVYLDFGDRAVLQQFGLTPSQFRTLQLLDTEQGKTLIKLSEEILRNRSTVTRLIVPLEERHLIRRLEDPTDRRSSQVVLTAEGVALRTQAEVALHDSLNLRFEVLTPDEQRKLLTLLAKLRNSLAAVFDGSTVTE